VTHPPPRIDFNPEFRKALEIMEDTGRHLLLTGKAGTGKSTLLNYFREHTGKNAAILAPTGVAALNIEGQTIHSFFRFKPDVTWDNVRKLKDAGLYRRLDAVVIDEISMVRADLLDCVDRFLRLNGREQGEPFGGLQLIMIGDLYQIPPVVTWADRQALAVKYPSPHFFSASVFAGLSYDYVELEKVYRQKDAAFVELLNAIRNNTVSPEQLETLNRRTDSLYEPPGKEMCVTLTPTNAAADAINEARLARLPGAERRYEGVIRGTMENSALPAPLQLPLKPGAQVMMVSNDAQGRWVNGTMGRLSKIRRGKEEDNVLEVVLRGSGTAEVLPHKWEMFRFSYNSAEKRLDTEVTGTYTQYPLRLAWAVTIHKSQGKTLDRVIIDLGRGAFTGGQTYVALSRCSSFEGLILRRPLRKRDIMVDWRIVKFLTSLKYGRAHADQSVEAKLELIREAIRAKRSIAITYLKATDVASKRVVTPLHVGELEYDGRPFLGLRAYCHLRREERVFRVDRILSAVLQ
jgi:energy-coupling factor transporter ATP-binding protein EcfA2